MRSSSRLPCPGLSPLGYRNTPRGHYFCVKQHDRVAKDHDYHEILGAGISLENDAAKTATYQGGPPVESRGW
jgi:hypothetical protein